jgi:hypothetical protein
MKNLLMFPVTHWKASLSALALVLAVYVGSLMGSPQVVQPAEAALPPEAEALVRSLERDVLEYAEGEALERRGQELKARAAAAAKGKDLTLCAEYQIRYDRADKKTISDANCPLL